MVVESFLAGRAAYWLGEDVQLLDRARSAPPGARRDRYVSPDCGPLIVTDGRAAAEVVIRAGDGGPSPESSFARSWPARSCRLALLRAGLWTGTRR
jgi:hypothetical protein